MVYLKKSKLLPEEDSLTHTESVSTVGVVEESGKNIAKVFKRINKINESAIDGLITENISALKKAKKSVLKLESEIEDLQNNTFYFIKNLQEASVNSSTFYINVIGELQDITQSVGFVAKITHKHVHNNHQSLKKNQAKELKDIQLKFAVICKKVSVLFDTGAFKEIPVLNEEISKLLKEVAVCAQIQVERTRTTESSPKNATFILIFY